MKDLIPVKFTINLNQEEKDLKKLFEKENFSLPALTVDSFSHTDPKFKETLEMNSRLDFLNRILFNFMVFSVLLLSTFLLIIVLSIISKTIEIKNKVLALGKTGIQNLELAKDNLLNLDTDKSLSYFKLASSNFEEANTEYSKAKLLETSASVIPILSSYQQNAESLLAMGRDFSSAGIELTQGIKEITNDKDGNALNLIQNVKKHTSSIEQKVNSIEASLLKINTNFLDKDTAGKIEKIKLTLPKIKRVLKITEEVNDNIPEALGVNKEKNYLIVFQNNNEMRSTGGFIGSFGILKMENGQRKDFFINDIYELDNNYAGAVKAGLTPYIKPPYPMDPQFTGNWALRDANTNPDFSKSAQNIIDFYKKEVPFLKDPKYPEEIDGVISVTPSVLESILEVTGPLNLDEYGLTLNSKNLLETLQMEVEAGQDKAHSKNPKSILEVLKNKLLERFSALSGEDLKKMILAVAEKADGKHILFYSRNDNIQKFFGKLNWTGEINKTEDDFLMVINNNYGGGKSSLKINEDINQEIDIKEDGAIVKKVSITREHTSDYYLKYFDPWEKQEKWLVGTNDNYIKVYVPKGSKLIKSEGFENRIDIFNEGNKTAFGSLFSLVPKQKKTATLYYKLPFKIQMGDFVKYSGFYQKQSGSLGSTIETKVILPSNTNVKSSEGNLSKNNNFEFSGDLSRDRFLNIIYSPL